MKAHRIDAKVDEDGTVTVRNLPFQEGEDVEVIVLRKKQNETSSAPSLKNSVLRFEDPFAPAVDETAAS